MSADSETSTDTTKSDFKISIVVPAYNEAGNIAELFKELRNVFPADFTDWEMLFVDDGSRDSTWEAIEGLSASQFKPETNKARAWEEKIPLWFFTFRFKVSFRYSDSESVLQKFTVLAR
jgi:glycosyltransferase involved in cell wall biosynthesis